MNCRKLSVKTTINGTVMACDLVGEGKTKFHICSPLAFGVHGIQSECAGCSSHLQLLAIVLSLSATNFHKQMLFVVKTTGISRICVPSPLRHLRNFPIHEHFFDTFLRQILVCLQKLKAASVLILEKKVTQIASSGCEF